MSSTFQALSQPQPYAAMVHSSMYRKADMGTRLSKLNSSARKPCLQQHSTTASASLLVSITGMPISGFDQRRNSYCKTCVCLPCRLILPEPRQHDA
jgi:hypothetical protein